MPVTGACCASRNTPDRARWRARPSPAAATISKATAPAVVVVRTRGARPATNTATPRPAPAPSNPPREPVSINAQLSLVFFVAVPILGVVLYFVATRAHPRFQKMLACYDRLNARVEESLIAIRVVKAFVRHEYEEEKFEK